MTHGRDSFDGESLEAWPDTLWRSTAGASPVVDCAALPARVDLTVVGGGITGLSAAIRAAEHGASVLLLEQGRIGWGASGRNGGSVVVGLKGGPGKTIAEFGQERGEALVRFTEEGPARLYAQIARHGIACDLHHAGHVTGFHTPKARDRSMAFAADWEARGAPVSILDTQAAAQMIGSDLYCGALYDKRCANLHPLKLVFGLARAALGAGVQIRERTAVMQLVHRDGATLVETQDGSVRSDKVLLALNAYCDSRFPKLANSFLNPTTCIVATDQLPDEILRSVLPGGQAAADSRRVLNYFRRTPDGRVMLGGRGPMRAPRGSRPYRAMEHALSKVFPQLRDARIEYRWFGRLSIPMDFQPHMQEVQPGVLALNGYAGKGVALGAQLGAYGADRLCAASRDWPDDLLDPMSDVPIAAFRRLYVGLGSAAFRMIDLIR
jgi:glycine/D-amino acid oxidase-like deaminating enzyme